MIIFNTFTYTNSMENSIVFHYKHWKSWESGWRTWALSGFRNCNLFDFENDQSEIQKLNCLIIKCCRMKIYIWDTFYPQSSLNKPIATVIMLKLQFFVAQNHTLCMQKHRVTSNKYRAIKLKDFDEMIKNILVQELNIK